jgi:hypothetical protein
MFRVEDRFVRMPPPVAVMDGDDFMSAVRLAGMALD